jgi:acetyl esterase/lipase
MQTFQYGPSVDQQADLHLPATPRPPVVCLLHGGFWRMPYGRDQMSAVAADLVGRGLAVWNMEYRRLGAPDTVWPATLADVNAGIEHLAEVRAGGIDLDLDRVIVAGHSAGGHLALCAAGHGRFSGAARLRVRLRAAVGLAPIADLAEAYARKVGGEAVAELLGGAPSDFPDRLRFASPVAMLPLRVRQLILHGTNDKAVPVDLSRRYAQAAEAAGDTIEFTELPGTGHMEFLDPGSDAHLLLCRWLAEAMRGNTQEFSMDAGTIE